MAGEGESADPVYKIVELAGASTKRWEEAAKNAVNRRWDAARPHVADIAKADMR